MVGKRAQRAAVGGTQPTRKSRRLSDQKAQPVQTTEKKKNPPKKVKEVAKAKPEEEKKQEEKTKDENLPENGDAKAEKPGAEETDKQDGEGEEAEKTE